MAEMMKGNQKLTEGIIIIGYRMLVSIENGRPKLCLWFVAGHGRVRQKKEQISGLGTACIYHHGWPPCIHTYTNPKVSSRRQLFL